MRENIIKLFKDKKTICYLVILLVSIYACIPMCSKCMDITTDDGIQHIYRLLGTFSSLQEGNMFPVIMSDFCNEFGYSWNLFYSPITAYLPLIFKLFTNSFIVCLKLFIYFTFFLSGLFMYKLVNKISKSYMAGLISACIYIMAPYHLTDLYNRMALAELTAFVFLPIVFIGMYELFNDNKKAYYIAIGAIGLTLTHNVLTIYTAIFCLIYMIINYKKINKKVIKTVLINIGIILLCTSFYWLPLIEHYMGATYEVFIPGRMYSNEVIEISKLSVLDLLYGIKWRIHMYVGVPTIIGLIFTFIYRKKMSKENGLQVATFLCFGIISLIMTLTIFPFEHLPNILKMIQFVWRMLIFSSFFLSIGAGITIAMFVKKNDTRKLAWIVVFLAFSIILVNSTKQITSEPVNEEMWSVPIPVTNNTKKVHAGCATFEYLPKNAYSNLDYIKTRSKDAIIIEGEGTIIKEEKNRTKMNLEIENVTASSKIELPYIYYLGYSAIQKDEQGNVTKLEIRESDKGFCMIEVSNVNSATINVNYTGTILMKVSYVLSIIGIICLIIYIKKLRICYSN